VKSGEFGALGKGLHRLSWKSLSAPYDT
jgi:hypothetical protein